MSDVRFLMYDIRDFWWLMSDTRCLMSDVWCACSISDVMCDVCSVSYVRMCDVWCPNCDAWIPLSDALRPADVWCAMSDVRFLMSDVRLPLFDVFVYSKLEQNLPGQAKCEPTVVFLVGLSAELYVNAYLCRGNIQWVKANLLKQYHCYSATTQTEDLERLSNHIFLKTKHPQGFVCKRTSVAEWLELWNL